MIQFKTNTLYLFEEQNVGMRCNQLQTEFPWFIWVTNGLEYYLLFQIPNLESDFSASLE